MALIKVGSKVFDLDQVALELEAEDMDGKPCIKVIVNSSTTFKLYGKDAEALKWYCVDHYEVYDIGQRYQKELGQVESEKELTNMDEEIAF